MWSALAAFETVSVNYDRLTAQDGIITVAPLGILYTDSRFI